MHIVVSGIDFGISESAENYNFYRLQFTELAREAEEKFKLLYDKENHSLDDVIHNGPRQYVECLQVVVEACVKRLVDENILSYDAARFWNEYSGFVDCWRDAYQEIEERYAAIVLSEKQMDEYRVMRRKARGRVVGGGFGVSGALKGMATAGAINAAAGAAHMMFNGAGKIVSDMRASSIKKEIFNNPNTKSSLADAAFQSAFQCHYALIACIKDNIPSFPCGCVTPEDAEQSYIRFENLKHLANDPSKVLHALMDIWKLNPYNTMCYDLMLSLLGDADGQLESLAAHFGYDLSTQEKKAA